MIRLEPMTEKVFEEFKQISQRAYALEFSETENLAFNDTVKIASEQFNKLLPQGHQTSDQFFFEAFNEMNGDSIGYLWLGIQERFGRKITSINHIIIRSDHRGQGWGKALMKAVEAEAKRHGSERVRLHVFQRNTIALRLYESMGFKTTSLDMVKTL